MAKLDGFLKLLFSGNPLYTFINSFGKIRNAINGVKSFGSDVLDSVSSSGDGNVLNNAMNKYLGTGLTQADREANEWTALREDTQAQRSVADYKAAGLNPALMFGNSGATGSYSSGSTSPSGGSLQDLVSLFTLPSQLKQLKSNIELQKSNRDLQISNKANVDADTNLKRRTARNMDLDFQFARDTYDARVEGIKNAAQISKEQIFNARVNRSLIIKQINTEIKRAESEEQRAILYQWQAKVEEANEKQIVALTPLILEYQKASTFAQQAAGSASLVHAAMEQAIIDSGQIENQAEVLAQQARKTLNEADKAEFDALMTEYKSALQTGHIDAFIDKMNTIYGEKPDVGSAIFGALNMVTSTLGNIFSVGVKY